MRGCDLSDEWAAAEGGLERGVIGDAFLCGFVPAAVDFEDVEGLLDGGGAVEDFLVAFAVVDGFEVALFEEVLEEGAGADELVGLGDGEAVTGGVREGGGHGGGVRLAGEVGLELLL